MNLSPDVGVLHGVLGVHDFVRECVLDGVLTGAHLRGVLIHVD